MQSVIRFQQSQIDSVLQACVGMNVDVRFTAARAELISAILDRRKSLLAELVGAP